MAPSRSRTSRTKASPKIALFVEGAHFLSGGAQTDALRALWEYLCTRLGMPLPTLVCGFSKQQVELLDTGRLEAHGVKATSASPLDLAIANQHRQEEFEHLIIAFDQRPANTLLPAPACVRGELHFILEHFVRNQRLPQPFLSAAAVLVQHYQREHLPQPRALEVVELVLMVPEFEALVVADETSLQRGLGFKEKPKDFPWNKERARRDPKNLLREAVQQVPRKDRPTHGDVKSNPHGWAQAVISAAKDNSGIFSHAIAERLRSRVCAPRPPSPPPVTQSETNSKEAEIAQARSPVHIETRHEQSEPEVVATTSKTRKARREKRSRSEA